MQLPAKSTWRGFSPIEDMMRWSDLPFNPSRRTLRQFAALWILLFGGLGGWHWLIGHDTGTATWMGVAAAIIGPIGLYAPSTVRPIFVGWMMLVFPVGWLVARIALIVLFGIVMTPLALLLRACKRDTLQLRRPMRDSYWRPRVEEASISRYFRQF